MREASEIGSGMSDRESMRSEKSEKMINNNKKRKD